MKVADWIIKTELQDNIYGVRKEGNENRTVLYQVCISVRVI